VVQNQGPVVLPACVKLSCPGQVPLQHVASIEAPQLQHLDALRLTVQLSEQGALRELCRGVLKACSSLSLVLEGGRTWSKEDTVALMTVLSQDWQPSAGVLQASVTTRINH
jgi:hypothetical protein